MLVQKQETPYIRVFKLASGEEFIARVEEETMTHFLIKDALTLGQTAKGLQFVPIMLMSDNKAQHRLNRQAVVIDVPPTEQLEAQYESMLSGIAVPPKQSIIV